MAEIDSTASRRSFRLKEQGAFKKPPTSIKHDSAIDRLYVWRQALAQRLEGRVGLLENPPPAACLLPRLVVVVRVNDLSTTPSCKRRRHTSSHDGTFSRSSTQTATPIARVFHTSATPPLDDTTRAICNTHTVVRIHSNTRPRFRETDFAQSFGRGEPMKGLADQPRSRFGNPMLTVRARPAPDRRRRHGHPRRVEGCVRLCRPPPSIAATLPATLRARLCRPRTA